MVYGFYQQGGSNGKVGFIISVDKGTEKRCGNGPSPQMQPKKWTHLAATYDGSEMKLYYDGEVKVEINAKGKMDTTEKVDIGNADIGLRRETFNHQPTHPNASRTTKTRNR